MAYLKLCKPHTFCPIIMKAIVLSLPLSILVDLSVLFWKMFTTSCELSFGAFIPHVVFNVCSHRANSLIHMHEYLSYIYIFFFELSFINFLLKFFTSAMRFALPTTFTLRLFSRLLINLQHTTIFSIFIQELQELFYAQVTSTCLYIFI